MSNTPTQALNFVKKVLFFDHIILEWAIRILIPLNIVLPNAPYASHSYPVDVLVMTALAYLLAVGKLKLFSLIILLLASYITSIHLGLIPGMHITVHPS